MRLLFLLSFLGSWSIIGSDTNTMLTSLTTSRVTNKPTQTNSPTAEPGTTQSKASTSATSSRGIIATAQSTTSQTSSTQIQNKSQSVTDTTTPSAQSNYITTRAQNTGSTTTIISPNHSSMLKSLTTSGVQNNTTENISTTVKPGTTHTVGKTTPPSPSSRGSTSASASSSPKPTVGSSTASPSQGLSKPALLLSTPTSVSVVTPNAPTESIGPNASTERTNGSSVETVTNATGKVQNTTMDEAWVKNTTGMMTTNATSGAFTDGTGHSGKSISNIAGRNAVDEPGAASTTLKPKGNDTISSTAYCVKESSNQNYSILIMKDMDCETFVSKKGKALADTVCSGLVKAADLRGLDKCEVQFSLEKEHRGKLNIDVSFKVSDLQMNYVVQKVQEAMKQEFHQESEEKKQRQQSATELKKLIAMVVTGSLLLLVFLCAIVYRCSQRKSKLKDPYLTEELRTVDNGCHDNPAMDITERESEMEEKNQSKATYLENTDGWIVPMDTHMKDEVEEEDTHL